MIRRRILVAAVAALVVPMPATAATTFQFQATARASVNAQLADVQPAVDPAFVDSLVTSSGVGTSSLQSVQWPGFLPDAFFFLYGAQSVERVALGISEARWPAGPTSTRATQSDLLFANGGDPKTLPGSAGRSEAIASASGASGTVAATQLALAGGSVERAVSATSIVTDTEARASARQFLEGISIGPLAIGALRGTASADALGGAADARLVIADATVAGTPVAIDDRGISAVRDEAQPLVDAALAESGMEVRLVPTTRSTEGTRAAASSGGVLVRIAARAEDPTGTPRDVQVAYLLGNARVATSADVREIAPPVLPTPDVPEPTIRTITEIIPVRAVPLVAPAVPDQIIRRTIVTSSATVGLAGAARGAYAMLFIVGLGLLGLRPFLRAGART